MEKNRKEADESDLLDSCSFPRGRRGGIKWDKYVSEKVSQVVDNPQTSERVKLGNLVGDGATGQVFEARLKDKNESTSHDSRFSKLTKKVWLKIKESCGIDESVECAVKTVNYSKMCGVAFRVPKEVAAMKALDHPNIVSYLGSYVETNDEQDGVVYIVMEKMEKSLHDEWRERGPFKDREIAIVAKQLLEGVAYMHSQGYMHRDLKPDNLMFDKNDVLKIVDFGTVKNSKYANSRVGTRGFRSPQGENAEIYSELIDIYAVGVTLFQLSQDKLILEAIDLDDKPIEKFLDEAAVPITPELKRFLARCMQPVEKDRASAKDLLEDPFLAHLN